MSPRLFRRTAALAAAWALAGSAVVSAGQAPDTAPPGTVTLGPLRITPSLVLKEMGVDDNVFNQPVDPARDFTFTLSPRADVLFRMRRVRLNYVSTTEYVYYQKHKSERGTNTSSAAQLEVDLGRVKPHASISGLNTKARLNSEVDARARHRDLLYGAGVGFKVGWRTSLVFSATQTTVDFAPDETFRGVVLERSLDARRRTADLGVDIALTPLTTLRVALTREQQRFDLSPDRDSNSWRIGPALTFSPSGVVTGTASVSFRRFQPLSPTLPGYAGLVTAVSVGATLYGRHAVQGVFNRDVQYSYETANTYYLATGGTMTWTLVVVGPIDVRGTGGRTVLDYRTRGDGKDTMMSYGGGVGYRFSNRARLGLNAEWLRRDSNRAEDRNFRNHKLFAGLTWGT